MDVMVTFASPRAFGVVCVTKLCSTRSTFSRTADKRNPSSDNSSAAKQVRFVQESKQEFGANVLLTKPLDSSAAYASIRLCSLLRGRSTEVETCSRTVEWFSICLRMDSTET